MGASSCAHRMSLRSFNSAIAPFTAAKPRGLPSIISPEKCQVLIDRLDLQSKYPKGKTDVVEVFSSNPLLGSMINMEIQPRRHYLVEHARNQLKTWKQMVDTLNKTTGNQEHYQIYHADAYQWPTYTNLLENEIKPQMQDRSRPHDELLLLANLSSPTFGESLWAQWLQCGIYRNWLHRYGRVRMLLLVPELSAQKFTSYPYSLRRNRTTVKFEMYASLKLHAITGNPKKMTSFSYPGEGYDPRRILDDQPIILEPADVSSPKAQLAVIEMIPHDVDPHLDHELYSHILQQFFSSRDQQLVDILPRVAPGAEDLAPQLGELAYLTARDLSLEQWQNVFGVFDSWPFKPSDLDFLDLEISDRRT
ncbi:hypothetical protein DIURU_002656 [Diutina rugosa]|uniref:rRNA adenine N(6)-methyltransferase n=1 Tax=Diutina rugosa TaxID=5481 RepID=A0A642UPB7_DIURU|nr:uncharacterized protein DIURU_002656 [Diutina rugosa]KAA8902760.1 hypothetical protein DIURU_002656 [Diutina rugosa]